MKKGYFLVFLTSIISGFTIFINKFGVSISNPYIYTFLRLSIVTFLLTGAIFIFNDWKELKKLTKKQWFLLILIGLIGGGIPFLLFFKGLSLTNAAQASFIQKTMFIYVAILAPLILKEKIEKEFLFGGLLLMLGSLFLLKKLPLSINRGDFLIFLATLFWALENTISKYLLRGLSGKIVAWSRMFFGSLFILIFLLLTNQLTLLATINLRQIYWVIITAILLFGYVMTWYSGLKYIPVTRATAILLFGSPITTLLSLIFGGKIHSQDILSNLLIIFGIIIIIGFKEIWKLIKEIKKLVYVRA